MVLQYLVDPWINRYRKISPAAMEAVEGQTPAVVVTGGSRGVGLAIAIRFAQSGRTVALVARNESDLALAAEKVQDETGRPSFFISCDITDPNAVHLIKSRLAEHGCYCDVLVNNAGTGQGGLFVQHEASEIEAAIDLNVHALTRLTRQMLPAMLARGRGGIINVSSLGGMLPGPYQAVYYASKSYVISFTRALAFEVSGRGVRISCVAPGPVRTSFHDHLDHDHRALYRYLLPWMSPKRVAASTYRGYLLGHPVVVPGLVNSAIYTIIGLLPYAVAVPLVGMLLYPGPNRRAKSSSKN